MESIQSVKQRFEIIGNDPKLNRAIEKAIQVAPTDISVLVTGESGVGKENIPRIIHALSHRKHNKYIAVNCGAIPEGTIDSELFGHEKGAFTGAASARSGYFDVADGGTIFLDEVGELPLPTQVRLLRVLENGEFMKVGSSQIQKTDVRIVAATNVNMAQAIDKGRFREDLYYRLSTVEIGLPALRERNEDIHLLFRKFASDFAQKYKMPTIRLDQDAVALLLKYHWGGNIRQLRNITEQLSVLEQKRDVGYAKLKDYLPHVGSHLPAVINTKSNKSDFGNEREILYKVLFDMQKDINDLKKLTLELINSGNSSDVKADNEHLIKQLYAHTPQNSTLRSMNEGDIDSQEAEKSQSIDVIDYKKPENTKAVDKYHFAEDIEEEEEESLSLHDKELELIKKSLDKYEGKRKEAAQELGISERTLYRKIKQFNL
ncbi:MAG: AAA family ATPase [Cryomorphaceae bacterium BACL21 MAG-121220-bin10]|jgi:transcriptional regulator with PAS, ATPase and Fis domain|nr:MAG: AAA family ATPase [Cryomorphaceae bacterium BACL21 MAG-121220-bin10]